MAKRPENLAGKLRALSNPKRLEIMQWLADPVAHFPPQRDGDLVDDGVCVGFITRKIGLSQPTVTEHMQVLADADLVTSKKIKNWVFYKSRADAIAGLLESLTDTLSKENSAGTAAQRATARGERSG